MYSKPIPLRVLLIATFVLQTVAAVSLTVWLAWRNEQSSITEMDTYVQIESFRKIQDRLNEYLNSAAVINRLNHQTLTRARTPDPAESLTAQFLQQRDLSAAVPVTAIYFGSTEGQFLGLVSEQDKNWSIARTHRGTDWRYATYAMNTFGQATRLLDLGKPYDPRQRPWYTNALKQGKSRWSVVYQDFQEPTLVMTMSEPAYNPQGKLLGVVGVDITLTQLSTFLRSLLMPKLALLLVVDSNGQLVATSTAQKPFVVRNNIAQRISALDLPDPTVQATTPMLKKALAQWKATHVTHPETFNVQGIPYTLRLAPLQDDYGLDFVVIAAMPNNTFQQQIANHSRETLLLCVAVLMTAILLGLIAARRLSQDLHQFLDSGQAIADGNLNQSIPQSRVQELNQLAQTFNRMAQHLRQAFDELELRVQERTAALKQSEEKFAKVFYAHPNGIALSKLHDGQFIDANDSALQLFGYKHHEFIGQTSTELGIWISNEAPNPTTKPLQYPVRALECCVRTQGGELKTILYSADLIELNGEPYLISLMQDITDRKRAEDALRRSEEKFAKIFHANPNPMTISRVEDGYFLDANESAANFLETDVSNIVGHTSSALQIWVDLQQRSQFLTALHNNGVIRGQECHLRTRTGRVRTVLYSAEQIEIEGQACLISTINDISDRRQAEEALRHAEEKYRSIFENSIDGIFQSTPTGQFLSANPALARMYGYKSPDILLREVTDIAHQLYLDPAQRQQFMQMIEQQGFITNFEALTFRRDGSTIWILIDARVVRDANGCVLYYEGTVKDTTDKRVAEEALKYAKAEAEAANRAKSTFFSNMSHELRTPLNAILGFTQVLNRDQTLSPLHREHLDIINRSGEHLLEMINGVLDMAKIEAGRIEVNRSSFDLFNLLETLENMFRMKAQSKGIYLGFERAATVPQFIHTDEGKLRQILINLIGNAIKFTDHGYVVVKVTLTTPRDHNTQHLKFEVQDTGPGIPANEQETIFEAFVQGKLVRQPQTGTGLGLPISREFIHLLGGEISVQSTLNQGTCFWFYLPAESSNILPISAPPPMQQIIGLAEGEPCYRLLVVDDSLESRQLMRSLLEPLGFEIREAKNGKEAIQVWEDWSPHLVWMDMQMPVMDGYEATRQIQQRSSHDPMRTAPIIIALTASVLENEKESILAAGCNDFVQKPFREASIFQALQQHLGVQFVSQVVAPSTFASTAADCMPSDHADTLEHLKCMPADWITEVYRAAQEVNNSALMHYIEQIPERHHTLAHTLASLVHHFRCDIIVELTRQAL